MTDQSEVHVNAAVSLSVEFVFRMSALICVVLALRFFFPVRSDSDWTDCLRMCFFIVLNSTIILLHSIVLNSDVILLHSVVLNSDVILLHSMARQGMFTVIIKIVT